MRWKNWMTASVGLTTGALLVVALPEGMLFAPRVAPATDTAAITGERYACPMMDFIGTRPGDCPICGMKMTKVTAGELTREQQRRMGVELARVTSGPAVATLRAYGTVRYDDRTLQVIVPRVPGRIVRRHPAALHFGTEVGAGAPVVDLYSPEAFAAQGELAAAVKLGEAHTIHALVERFMRWNLAAIAAAVIEGKAPVDTITLTAPFAGLVVAGADGGSMENPRLPQVGQEVMADTVLLRLVEPRSFMIALQVPEARAHWLRVGQSAQLASDDRGELPEVTASISWISPELNAELRSREIHLHLQDPAGRLLAGSLVQARISAALGADGGPMDPSRAEAAGTFTLIPKAAVLSTGVRHVAWRVAEHLPDGRLRFELVPLALGPRLENEAGQDLLVVRAGVRPGDEVAAQGAFLIDAQAQLAGTASLLFPRGAAAPAPGHSH